nr:CrpP family ICE-associated protein [Pseudomonas oryzihabitans]
MVNEALSKVTSMDGRSGANAHRSAMRAGEAAGLARAGVHTCPYQHPAFRSSWLKGYAQAQQQSFDF